MKPSNPVLTFVAACLLPSCSLMSSDEVKKQAYQDGFRAGVQNEIKRQYFADQNAVLPLPADQVPEFKPVVVPEHVAPDGVIISEHEVVTTPDLPAQ